MKKAFLLACLLLVSCSAFAVTINVSDSVPQKGQEIAVSGKCAASVLVEGTWEEKTVFSSQAPCVNGSYSVLENLSFLVPSGSVSFSASENGETASKTILVKPTRESAFLAVSLLSPTARSLERNETVGISVSVLDAGTPAQDAVVQTWDFENKPVQLEMREPGIYAAEFKVPLDAPLSKWVLAVTAQSQTDSGLVGGEQFFSFPIEKAPILVQVDSPSGTNLYTLEKIPFRFTITYPDGTPLQNGSAEIRTGSGTVPLQSLGNGSFETSLSFPDQQAGTQKITVWATDSSQNTGTKELDFFVSAGLGAEFQAVLPYLLAVVLLFLLVSFVVLPGIRAKKKAVFAEQRKKEIEAEITALQTQYFDQNATSKESFAKKTASLNRELEELDKTLNTPKN